MPKLINASQSLLLIIDIQEKLATEILGQKDIVDNVSRLMKMAEKLDVETITTEQYPKGLGATLGSLNAQNKYEKITFSCVKDETILNAIKKHESSQIIVVGMETHVCVLQSVLDLIDLGYDVFVVADGVGSRKEDNKQLGLERMKQAGATIVSTEMVMFEWLERAGTKLFKECLPLIK